VGAKGQVQDWWGRKGEVDGGDIGEGRVRGGLAPFVFLFCHRRFSSPLSVLFWVGNVSTGPIDGFNLGIALKGEKSHS